MYDRLVSRGLVGALPSHSRAFSVVTSQSRASLSFPVIPCRLAVPWSRGLVVSLSRSLVVSNALG